MLDVEARTVRYFAGTAPSLAANGSMMTFLTRGPEFAINVFALGTAGAPVVVLKSTDSLAAPALSPSGKTVAYQMMTEHDWEIYAMSGSDGSDDASTRDIQHDLLPRFLDDRRSVAVQGEPRHRRSFIYDARTGARTRLFHNNTVRTIAPEYEWAPSRDGTKVLIVAERDGDTVSPERGVYLMDLDAAGHARRAARAVADESRRRAARCAPTAPAMFAPIAADGAGGRRDASGRPRLRLREGALRLRLEAHHAAGQPSARRVSVRHLQVVRLRAGDPVVRARRGRARRHETANVVATLNGTVNPELVYVVSSHYDSVAVGPGADDDTSGTAALLEAARVLAGHPHAGDDRLRVVHRRRGRPARQPRVRAPRGRRQDCKIVGALNNDMIGWANDHRLDNTIRYSNPGIRDIQHAAAMLFTQPDHLRRALLQEHGRGAPTTTAYGDIVGGIGSYPVLGNPHYHQPHDLLETRTTS